MKINLIIALAFSLTSFAELPEGLREVEYSTSLHPIFGIEQSLNGGYLAISCYGGRFYMLSVDLKSKNNSAFSQKEKLLWTKFLSSDFKWGGKPVFSPSGEYVLLKPVYDNINQIKVKPTDLVVFETATGNMVYERKNEVLSADIIDNENILVSTTENIEWINLKSGAVSKRIAMPEVEIVAVSKDKKYLAASFVPTVQQFALLQSIKSRKKELKIANRGKRLIAFYDFETMEPVSVVDDEIDIVFGIKFNPPSGDALVLTRNFKRVMGGGNANLRQENAAKLLLLNVLKIDIASGEIDRKFYYCSNHPHMDFKTSQEGLWFGHSTSVLPGGGNYVLSTKMYNGLDIYHYQYPDSLYASIKTRFKLFKTFGYAYQFAFIPDSEKAYFGFGTKLYEWDFNKLNDFVFNNDGNSNQEIINLAIQQLDSLNNTSSFKKFISSNKIEGFYTFDITVFKKGVVSSVFSPSDAATDIKSHNIMLDYVKAYKFDDLEIPKDKRIKFQYTFTINNP